MDVFDIFVLAIGLLEVLHKLERGISAIIIVGLRQHTQRSEQINNLFHVL